MSERVTISTVSGELLAVALTSDGERAHSCLMVDGIRYHFERVTRGDLLTRYMVDADPDYVPQADAAGHCYILAPYSE